MLMRILFPILLLPLCIQATAGDVVHYQETADWIIFKKNGNEIFAAKQVRYNEESIFYAHDCEGKVYFKEQAQKLWEDLEELYRKNQEQENPAR
jgi:hypothetical protein